MSKMKYITIPEMKFSYRVYRDPSYSERFPWVLEINGDIENSYSFRELDEIALSIIKRRMIPYWIDNALEAK